MVMTSPEVARKFTDAPVNIIGSGHAQDTLGLFERSNFSTMQVTRLAANEAYQRAGVGPKDIDIAEVHDCFTIAEIIAYEDLGFCNRGEGGKLIDEGETHIGARLPINTSGGLKAKGHPVGATGVAQACEIYLQLTNQAGRRQVEGADIGLTENVGGAASTGLVHIYQRGD